MLHFFRRSSPARAKRRKRKKKEKRNKNAPITYVDIRAALLTTPTAASLTDLWKENTFVSFSSIFKFTHAVAPRFLSVRFTWEAITSCTSPEVSKSDQSKCDTSRSRLPISHFVFPLLQFFLFLYGHGSEYTVVKLIRFLQKATRLGYTPIASTPALIITVGTQRSTVCVNASSAHKCCEL